MELKKNDSVELNIQDMTTDGEGVGKLNGFPLFVKDAIIGDTIRAKIIKLKKNYGYARLERVLISSPDRVEPRCSIARQCGGCQIQEMSYPAQLSFKQKLVENNLQRIGGITDYKMLPIVGMEEPFAYRNKAQFPVGADKDGNIKIGFYAGRTHAIMETDRCHIGNEINEPILELIKSYMTACHIPPYNEADNTGVIRHILIRTAKRTGEVMVCLVINADTLPQADALITRLRTIKDITSIMVNVNKQNTNVIMSHTSQLLWGKPYIEDYIGNVKYHISPNSFYQVNPVQTEKLYGKALEFAALNGNETVWDLYCGIGTISLFLAQKAKKVYGVEIVEQAILDARENAKFNAISNAEFFVGKAEEVLPSYYEEHKDEYADVIVVDPPRKGCDEKLLETIIKMQPQRVVYVSCDSATLARDLKYLEANGYKVNLVQCYDQFCHTVHVETVCLLSKK